MPRPFTVGGLHAWEWPGDPPGGLLLHGIGNYGRYWDFFADAIAGRLRLIAPDARGHGESAKPAEDYGPADFVADAVAVMDASDLARPVVVGHSMGGYHATALALAHPKHALAKILDATEARPATWDRLGEIACPVLIVRGTRSPSLAAETAEQMRATLKNARLIELDAGHNVALDRPRELADAVVQFTGAV